MNSHGRNMYVFRDGKRLVSTGRLVAGLAGQLRQLARPPETSESRTLLIDTLLRAGELECALTDLGWASAAGLARITDELARRLTGAAAGATGVEMLGWLTGEMPEQVQMAPAEGFAYYALHPLDFADLADRCEVASGRAAVVGIRSIGTTLSAVVGAALERRGVRVSRRTVRPKGHPYDRMTELGGAEREWVAGEQRQGAEFLVVDEGPGMSGSSFLSVGDALKEAGAERVRFLCSREPVVGQLCARGAAERWAAFPALYAAPARRLPDGAEIYLGGGYWRHELLGGDTARWPASWSQMERLKFLSADRRRVFKFEGFGRFGAEWAGRWQQLSEAGFAPRLEQVADGFLSYPFVKGRILEARDLEPRLIERMADYCALRRWEFQTGERADHRELEEMLRFNVAEEFGVELGGEASLPGEGPAVLVDGRMLPHEWIRGNGRYWKCDGTGHGDDHFFPGPTADIAWDLAGAVVEWEMNGEARWRLLERYRRRTGDRAGARLGPFLLAYAVFRMGYANMAAEAMRGSEEEPRLRRMYGRYRRQAAGYLGERGALDEALVADPTPRARSA